MTIDLKHTFVTSDHHFGSFKLPGFLKVFTEEQEKEIQMLLANKEMLEISKKDAENRGKKNSVKQIERAQEDVIKQINSIDPSALNKRKASSTIFDDTDI